jgi:hypothetical protein
VIGSGAAGGVGNADRAAVWAQHEVGCVEWAGGCVGGHPGRLHGVCGRLSWPGGGGEKQLVQLGNSHSRDRLVSVGGKAGLVQLAEPRLFPLQLDVGA